MRSCSTTTIPPYLFPKGIIGHQYGSFLFRTGVRTEITYADLLPRGAMVESVTLDEEELSADLIQFSHLVHIKSLALERCTNGH